MEKKLSLSEILQKSFKQTIDNAFLLFFKVNLIWIGFIFLFIVTLVPIIFTIPLNTPAPFLIYITIYCLAVFISYCALHLGYTALMLDIHDRGTSNTDQLFKRFNATLIAQYIICHMLYLLVVGFGFLLLILPGIYFMLRLEFFYLFIVDKKSTLVSSLRQSWQLTRGVVAELLLFYILSIIIYSLGGLIIFGWLFTIPFIALAKAHIYRSLQAQLPVQTEDIGG